MMSICPILRDILPYKFVPTDVDKSFRQLVFQTREERSKKPLQHEDFFQFLLNSVNKHGKKYITIPFPRFVSTFFVIMLLNRY